MFWVNWIFRKKLIKFFLIFENKYNLNNNYIIISNNISSYNIDKNNPGNFKFISYRKLFTRINEYKDTDLIFFLAGNISINKKESLKL